MGQEIGQKVHLNHIDQNTPITPHINSYDIFIHVRNILMFLKYYHNIIYFYMCEYISISLCCVYCILQDCNFKNSIGKIIYHCIIWYFIQKLHKTSFGTIFSKCSSKPWPFNKS